MIVFLDQKCLFLFFLYLRSEIFLELFWRVAEGQFKINGIEILIEKSASAVNNSRNGKLCLVFPLRVCYFVKASNDD